MKQGDYNRKKEMKHRLPNIFKKDRCWHYNDVDKGWYCWKCVMEFIKESHDVKYKKKVTTISGRTEVER